MNIDMLNRLTHLLVRSLSILAKFILVIFIGKYLTNESLGEYALFSSSITVAIFFLGMDFYVFNTREIINCESNREKAILIRDQFLFYIFTYILILPALFIIFLFNIISYEYILYFYIILVVEHLSQEIYRLLITLSKQTLAIFLLFIRSGLWIYIIAVLWLVGLDDYKTLYSVYKFWFFSAFCSILIGIYVLIREYGFFSFYGKINFFWIKHGFRTSIPFFIGTIAYKIVEFSNRYIIDLLMTKSDVGIFTFYSSIANSLQTIIYTLVIMIYYPKLLMLYKVKDNRELKRLITSFKKEIIIYSLLMSLLISLMSFPLFLFLGKDEFIINVPILLILLLATFFINLSFVYHYQLFAMNRDIAIRDITVFVAMVNVALTFIMVNYIGLYGAAIATLISFYLMFFMKRKYLIMVREKLCYEK